MIYDHPCGRDLRLVMRLAGVLYEPMVSVRSGPRFCLAEFSRCTRSRNTELTNQR